jgi:hypothetical protein
MKKLFTRLLLLITALSILLLSGYSEPYANQEVAAQSSTFQEQLTGAGAVSISQSAVVKTVASTAGKESGHFKIDPAEVEEDELDTFSKFLPGSSFFTPVLNLVASGIFLQNSTRKYLLAGKYTPLISSYDKYLVFQVFRI